MDNWLNVFTAVRNANAFDEQRHQNQFENKLAARQDQRNEAQAGRVQETYDTDRAQRTTLGALSAYSNMADTIANSDAISEADRPQAYAAAFDRIAPALTAAGYDPQRVDTLRAQLIENPGSASDLLAGLQEGLGGTPSGSHANLQAAFDANGRAVFVDPRTGRPAARGYSPATAVLGNRRLDQGDERLQLGNDTLSQRQYEQNPDTIQTQSAARSEGQAEGASAATVPRLNAITDNALARIDALQENESLDTVFGLPNLARLSTGGFGAAGVVPGSPAADALAQLNQTIGDVQTAAYESLRGGGSITEAERTAISAGLANLDRSQSPASALRALRQLRTTLDNRRNAVVQAARAGRSGQSAAAPSAAPAPAATQRAPTASAPASSDAHARRPNETTDAYLARLGL